LEEIKQTMIDEVIKKHGSRFPCENKTFEESFTQEGDILMFWFNDKSGSTKIITKNL